MVLYRIYHFVGVCAGLGGDFSPGREKNRILLADTSAKIIIRYKYCIIVFSITILLVHLL